MRKSEWWKQQTIENRAYKAWKARDKFAERVLERWLEAGNRTPEEFQQQCDALQAAIERAVHDQRVPIGMYRLTLGSMLAESVADTAPNMKQAGEDAAAFGQTIVQVAMQIFAAKHSDAAI